MKFGCAFKIKLKYLKQPKLLRRWYVCILISSLFVFMLSGGMMVKKYYEYWASKSLYAEVGKAYRENIVDTLAGFEDETSIVHTNRIQTDDFPQKEEEYVEIKNKEESGRRIAGKLSGNFETLLKINKDIMGWIYIPGTKIDYPVVRGEDNKYYLNRDLRKDTSPSGCIFMDYRNSYTDISKNTILYGHNMLDGSMFRDLMNYADQKFYESHKAIYIDTPSGQYTWEIMSAYECDTSFDYLITCFNSENSYEDFQNKIIDKSFINADTTLNQEDKILTLSTCAYDYEDARFVVHAKLVSVNEKIK